jgi:hypothetical protein
MLTDRRVTHYADDTVLNLDNLSGPQVHFIVRYFRLLVVIYQKLLHDWGRPGLLCAKGLDRFLLSKFAERCVFPLAGGLYPWVVKLVRRLKLYERSDPATSPATAKVPAALPARPCGIRNPDLRPRPDRRVLN